MINILQEIHWDVSNVPLMPGGLKWIFVSSNFTGATVADGCASIKPKFSGSLFAGYRDIESQRGFR